MPKTDSNARDVKRPRRAKKQARTRAEKAEQIQSVIRVYWRTLSDRQRAFIQSLEDWYTEKGPCPELLGDDE